MYGKSNLETYTTICKIDSHGEFAVWLRKLKQGLCINLEEWVGVRVGREVQKGGDICISMADSHHFMGNRWGNSRNSVRLYFEGLQNHCRW